jgi:predicted transcriptional regulator of viral defense system
MHTKYNDTPKTLGPTAARLVTTLHEWGKPSFRLAEVSAITGLKSSSARSLVRKLVARGVASRLRPGLFNLVPFELGQEREYLGNPYVVARHLMGGRPYYLSHSSAMDLQGMVTQPQLVVHVTSPQPMRGRVVLGTEYRFVRCKAEHFFGTSECWLDRREKVTVSDVERTVIDGLKQPEYCGGLTEVAKGLWLRRADVDVAKLVGYALRLDVGAVLRRLGYLLEVYEIGALADAERLRSRLTRTYVLLDPLLPAEGRFLARWRLRLNVEAEELRAVVRT